MAEEKKIKAPAKPKEGKKEKAAVKETKKQDNKEDKKQASKEKFVEEKVPVRLFQLYREEIIPGLVTKFKYGNKLETPQLKKICINSGVGQATQDPKLIELVAKEMERITGQKPVITEAKKSVSNFKLREGMKIGCKVTLRKAKMYEFLDRLINITIPRIRDFRGIPDRSFDGKGNYTLGIKEHIIFPEINIDTVTKVFGMDVTFVTSAKTDDEAFELLKS